MTTSTRDCVHRALATATAQRYPIAPRADESARAARWRARPRRRSTARCDMSGRMGGRAAIYLRVSKGERHTDNQLTTRDLAKGRRRKNDPITPEDKRKGEQERAKLESIRKKRTRDRTITVMRVKHSAGSHLARSSTTFADSWHARWPPPRGSRTCLTRSRAS